MAINQCSNGCPQLVINVSQLPDAIMANENQLYRLPNGDIYIVDPTGLDWDLLNNVSSSADFEFNVVSTNEITLTWNPSTHTLSANLAPEVKSRLNKIESRLNIIEASAPSFTADGNTSNLVNITVVEG